MSEDIEKKKSNYLLELALEEQWEKDTEMKKYEKIEETEPVHVFSKDHEERMREIFKMADEIDPGSVNGIVRLRRGLYYFSVLLHFQSHR